MTKTELRQICNIGRGRPRRRPLIWVGKRNGKNVWMINRSLPYKRLQEKYPKGTIGRTRRLILKLLKHGRNIHDVFTPEPFATIGSWFATKFKRERR